MVRYPRVAAWLPLAALPPAVWLLCAELPPWILMWALALSIYAGFKWLTYADRAQAVEAPLRRSLGYLLLWPGMNARSFLGSSRNDASPFVGEWLAAFAKTAFGLFLVLGVVPLALDQVLLAGWAGMAGMAFIFHFGIFHVLSLSWRRGGIDAEPIMKAPIAASSLSDFWGRRWNLAFRDLARAYVFRPFVRRLGVPGATMAVFVVSGIVHDLVISLPARSGWGLPTLYFVIQGFGLLFERSRFGRRIGFGTGYGGRLFCLVVTLGPVWMLFHPPFVERVVIPMLTAIGAI